MTETSTPPPGLGNTGDVTPVATKGWKSWSTKRKVLVCSGGAFAFFMLVGMCAGDPDAGKGDEPSPSTAPSTSAAPSETTAPETSTAESVSESPTPEAAPEPPKPPHDAELALIPSPQGEQVMLTFPIADNFTHGMIVSGAQQYTIDLLQWSRETYPNAASVIIEGTYPVKDEYGNTSTSTVLSVVYNADTVSRINFDGIDRDNVWELRDRGFVHSELRG